MAEYKSKMKRFNGTDYDTIYPATVSDVIQNKVFDFVLQTENWSGNTYTVTVSGMTSSTNGIIGIPVYATEEQYAAAESSGLRVTAQTNTGSLTITARNEVPTIDIPVQLIFVGIAGS